MRVGPPHNIALLLRTNFARAALRREGSLRRWRAHSRLRHTKTLRAATLAPRRHKTLPAFNRRTHSAMANSALLVLFLAATAHQGIKYNNHAATRVSKYCVYFYIRLTLNILGETGVHVFRGGVQRTLQRSIDFAPIWARTLDHYHLGVCNPSAYCYVLLQMFSFETKIYIIRITNVEQISNCTTKIH